MFTIAGGVIIGGLALFALAFLAELFVTVADRILWAFFRRFPGKVSAVQASEKVRALRSGLADTGQHHSASQFLSPANPRPLQQ